MKECPYCKELSGDAAEKCFNCGKALPEHPPVIHICPKCREFYKQTVKRCPVCMVSPVVYDPNVSYEPPSARIDTALGYIGYCLLGFFAPFACPFAFRALYYSNEEKMRNYEIPMVISMLFGGVFYFFLQLRFR